MTRIVIFAKQPLPGQVKTRLVPALGADGAARLAARMLAHTVGEAEATGLAVEVCGDPDSAGWFEGEPIRTAQGPGDLGERLARAARRVADGGESVLLIGTDCPRLDRAALAAAAASLCAHDAVIHPTEDGGYALLGLRRFDPSPFRGIAWSTDSVASGTIERIARLGWTLDLRETLRDVDEPADLELVGLG